MERLAWVLVLAIGAWVCLWAWTWVGPMLMR